MTKIQVKYRGEVVEVDKITFEAENQKDSNSASLVNNLMLCEFKYKGEDHALFWSPKLNPGSMFAKQIKK